MPRERPGSLTEAHYINGTLEGGLQAGATSVVAQRITTTTILNADETNQVTLVATKPTKGPEPRCIKPPARIVQREDIAMISVRLGMQE